MNHHPTLSLDTILHRSPTKQCGIAPHIITSITVYSCETMQEAGILLRLPQTVIAHAQVLFHRFYTKRSMTQFDTRYCSVSCLFLASKLNEKIKSVQSVLEAFDFVFGVLRNEPDYYSLQVHYQHQSIVQNSQNIFSASSQNNFPANSNVVSQLMQSSMTVLQRKNEILRLERIICAELGFILHNVSHAQTYILFFAHILELSDDGRLVQCAWNFCNDALKSSVLCLHVKPHVIACSAIFMAAKRLRLNLPQNPAWWLLFDTELEQILFVEQCLNELYDKFGGGGDSDVVLHENDENESAKVDDENGKREKRVNRARYHYILTRSVNGIGGGSSSGGDGDNNSDGGVVNDALYMDPQQLQSIKHEIELAKVRIEQQKREQREQREEEERQRRQQQTLSSSSHHGTADVVNDGGDGNGYRDDDYEYESYNNGNKRSGDHHRNRYVDRHHRGDEHQPQYHHHRSSSSSRGGHHSSGGYHYDDHYRRSSHTSRSYDERERTEDRGERQEDQWSRSSSGNDESRAVGRSSRRHYAPRSSSSSSSSASGASGSHGHASSSSSRTSSGSGRDRHYERDRDRYSGSSASSSSMRKRSRNDDDDYR